MKPIKVMFLSMALLSIPFLCHAQLYEVNISAALSTQVISGTNHSIHTVPVNDASIINAILASGSFPELKAKDLAVVYTNSGNEQVEVINTSSTNAVVAVIAKNGVDSSFNAIETVSKNKQLAECTDTDYEFTIPNVGATLVTNAVLKFDYNQVNGVLEFSFSFVGANGTYSPGATFFQGTIKRGTKVYQ